ncbi:MAG: hypothetical protein IKU86_04040 [Thermoguttaceae bacterium]|nr:hypothetical protein [Thermoguttaceae bacterium]
MKKNLLILGAGQFGLTVRELAESVGFFEKIDFLDDNNKIAVGKLTEYERWLANYPFAIVAIGSSTLRSEWTRRLEETGFEIPTLISSFAYVSPSARLGAGVIVEPLATVQARVSVGRGTIVSSGVVLRHDAAVGDFCHCDCNSVVASGASVPSATKVEIGEVFRFNRKAQGCGNVANRE